MNSALYGATKLSQRTRGATRAGLRMWDILYYLAIVLFLAVATITGAFALRAYLSGGGPIGAVGALFGPKPERRLSVMEQFNIDGRRRLILVRRDDVEHLIMTGGPVDVVIETGIGVPPASPGQALAQPGAQDGARHDPPSLGSTVSARAPQRS